VLAALHLSEPATAHLADLSAREWQETLDYAHRGLISLELARAARGALPQGVQRELDGCAARNGERIGRMRRIYSEIDATLEAAGIPWLALKGITQSPLFGTAADERPQYDIDLYVPPEHAPATRDILLGWGYEPMEGMEDFPTDHLPGMIRKTGWQWRGDYFDLDLPAPIEIHVRFWNANLERLPTPGIEQFWERRQRRLAGGLELPVLAPPDALGYASLHLVKHVLQGTLRPFHALEIARFLDGHAGNDAFWREWRATHARELRRLETVGFRLAQSWFGCELAEEIEPLSPEVEAWFDRFATSPISREFHPNKDELWLHLSLIESQADRWRVARRRLVPLRIPGPVSDVCTPASQMTLPRLVAQKARRAAHVARRVQHHAAALPRVIASGADWWLGKPFWIFLAAAALLNFGLFIFVLLYNLFLLELGFHEDFLGTLTSASTIGTMAGTLPAAWVMRRYGLRRSFIGLVAASALVVSMRALVRPPPALIGLAFVWGLIFALWAVLIAPLVSALVPASRRASAFSTFFACMIGVGVAGNWMGGRLPGLLHNTEGALLAAAALVLAALVPAIELIPAGKPSAEPGRIWPRGGFLKRYLAAFALWQMALGVFNPFANVYFARHGFSAAGIGNLFSSTQIVQVAALLLAPVLIRRAGLIPALGWMIAATALGLGGMAAGAVPVLFYTWYMSLQSMSEPGINTLLMNSVPESERNGASSLNYLVAFGAQAVAAYVAGHLFAKTGYGPVLAGAAVLTLIAALMFGLLIRPAMQAEKDKLRASSDELPDEHSPGVA